jgi:hypothetical protein
MTRVIGLLLVGVLCGALAAPSRGQEKAKGYLTADGKLTQALEIRDVQGGFAGFTGTHLKVEPDGKWVVSRVFREKLEKQREGQLSGDNLRKLAGALAKYDLLGLKSAGGRPMANPHLVTVEYGKVKATLTLGAGKPLPPPDAATPGGRYGGIVAAARNLTEGKKGDGKPGAK